MRREDTAAFMARVAAGDWPRTLQHGLDGNFYDYDCVRVNWSDGAEVIYQIGSDRSGYGKDSALGEANRILSAQARGSRLM